MQIIKKTRIIKLFLVLSYLIITSCKIEKFDADEFIYSNIGGMEKTFFLNDMSYIVGDSITSIKDCGSPEYPKCLLFDSTIIMLPQDEFFNLIEDGYFEGRNESIGLNYIIEETEIKILNEKISGYLFNVGNVDEFLIGRSDEGELKGVYFYSRKKGILFFEHNFDVMLLNEKSERFSIINWSITSCGIFSNYCK